MRRAVLLDHAGPGAARGGGGGDGGGDGGSSLARRANRRGPGTCVRLSTTLQHVCMCLCVGDTVSAEVLVLNCTVVLSDYTVPNTLSWRHFCGYFWKYISSFSCCCD